MDDLKEGTRNRPWEVALAAGGAAVGLFLNFIAVLGKLGAGQAEPLSGMDLITAVFFVGLVVLAISKYLESQGQTTKATGVLTKIKSGQKAVIKHED